MRKLIHFEDEAHESQTFRAFIALLLAAVRQIIAGAFWGELFTEVTTTAPLSVLDVQRAGRWPAICVRRDSQILVSETHYADGLEIVARWHGTRWTWRIGQVAQLIDSRAAYLSLYGAERF